MEASIPRPPVEEEKTREEKQPAEEKPEVASATESVKPTTEEAVEKPTETKTSEPTVKEKTEATKESVAPEQEKKTDLSPLASAISTMSAINQDQFNRSYNVNVKQLLALNEIADLIAGVNQVEDFPF